MVVSRTEVRQAGAMFVFLLVFIGAIIGIGYAAISPFVYHYEYGIWNPATVWDTPGTDLQQLAAARNAEREAAAHQAFLAAIDDFIKENVKIDRNAGALTVRWRLYGSTAQWDYERSVQDAAISKIRGMYRLEFTSWPCNRDQCDLQYRIVEPPN